MGRIKSGALALILACVPRGAWARSGVAHLLEDMDRAPAAEKPLIAYAIGARHKRKAAPELVRRFDFLHDAPEVSIAIAFALGELGDKRALDALLKAWNSSRAPGLRAVVAEALGEIGGQRALVALRQGMRDDDPAVAQRSVEALARLRDRDSIDDMIRMLEDRVPNTAQAAYEALGLMRGEKVRRALRAGLSHPSARVRAMAAYGLAEAGEREGERALEKSLKQSKGEDPDGLLAAYYLARLGKISGLDYLARIMQNEASPLRRPAAEALGKTGDVRAALPLADHRKDKDPEMRLSVATALGRLGGGRAMFALDKMRRDPDPGVRAAARAALARLGRYELP